MQPENIKRLLKQRAGARGSLSLPAKASPSAPECKSLISFTKKKPCTTAVVLRIDRHQALVRECEFAEPEKALRDSVCSLCETLVCVKLDISLKAIRAKTRSSADVALARQIAMYLAHTMFSLLMTEVGLHFGRDRTTVAHACALVEDRRDEFAFDTMICQLEAALEHAHDAIAITSGYYDFQQGDMPLGDAS